jgi:acetoin utilization protein AcuB
MLVKDIMTKKVITAPSKTSIGDAKKILREHRFRRLPVVDNGKLLGIVTEDRLDRVAPSGGAPLLWQVGYLISHTTLKDVMEKSVVTIEPDATVEQGVALAQSKKIGALLVVKNGKLVGIVTTNDFFYNVLNPVLGVGQTGSRIIINGGGEGKSAEKIIGAINKLGVDIKIQKPGPHSTVIEQKCCRGN